MTDAEKVLPDEDVLTLAAAARGFYTAAGGALPTREQLFSWAVARGIRLGFINETVDEVLSLLEDEIKKGELTA